MSAADRRLTVGLRILAVGAALLVSACATHPMPPVSTAPSYQPPPAKPGEPAPAPRHLALSLLPGWAEEDHAAALAAFRLGCGVSRDPDLAPVCGKAQGVENAQARAFFERQFIAEQVEGEGLLTAYFAPVYEARLSRRDGFTAPVRPKPADLALCDPRDLDPAAAPGPKTACLAGEAGPRPYPDRAAIEAVEEATPLAWMRPEDLFFLQIQGSGVLTLPDGKRFKALFAANNGRPFTGIAKPMREQGLLADADTSGEAIRSWLAAHRGADADAVMRLNPRYVFFRLTPDDGTEPVGAAGAPLPPGHAAAMDLSVHPLGAPYWIDAAAPALTGAFPRYQRFVANLDTGGAIKGTVRADLYIGSGDAAGVEAGRVRHALRLYRLIPRP